MATAVLPPRLLLCLVLLGPVAGPLAAQQTVTLRNGDRLTGTLKRVDAGSWIFTYGGEDVSLSAADVVGFDSPAPIGLRLDDGTIGAGTVEATPAAGGLRLTLSDGVRTVTPQQIAAVGRADDLDALIPITIGFFTPITRFWQANLAFGFSDKSGNSRARGISSTLDIERRTRKDRITLGFGLNRESSQLANGDFETTVSKYYGNLRVDVFVNSRFFFFGSTRQERDRFQDIALRSTYNTGLGFQAVAVDRTDLNFSVAGGARREKFISGGAETASVAAVASKLRHDFGPAVLLWQLDFSPTVEDLGDYRLISDISITAPLFLGIGFRIGALDEYNSRPKPGIEKNDLLLTTTLSYTIGR
jgi:putative salt-induced outer membrane protein YdiY